MFSLNRFNGCLVSLGDIVIILWEYLHNNYRKYYQKPNPIPLDVLALRKKYLSLQPPIKRSSEMMVPITEMYVYPIRGIRAGAQVDYLELGIHGVKYDREILLAAKSDQEIVTTNKYHTMGCLRQVLKGSKVTVTTMEPERLKAKNLPLSLTIELEEEPDKTGPFIEC